MVRAVSLLGLAFLFLLCRSQPVSDSLKLVLEKQVAPDSSRVTALLNLANTVIWQNPAEAMKYTNDAMKLSEYLKWQKGIALSLRQKGLVYYASSDLLNAMDYTLKASKAGELLHNKMFNASIDNNLANIYADLGQSKKALDYYNKYLNISKELKDETNEMNALVNIGNIYTELNDLPTGLQYFKKGLAIAEKNGNKNISGIILNNIGIIYKNNQNYDSALSSFHESIQIAKETDNKSAEATALTGLAQVYLIKGDYPNAISFALQSIPLSKEAEALQWQRDAYETLSAAYEKQHNNQKAFAAYKKYISLRDSILTDEKRQEISRKEMQFEFDKQQALQKADKDKKLYLASAAISRQQVTKNIIAGGAILLLITAFISFLFYKRKRDAEEQQKEAEFKAQVLDTEMKALRLQMNPHFIFNSLNSISDYILRNDLQAADAYLTKFAKVMRFILENAEQKQVALSEDLKALQWYMELESLRLNHKFSYQIKVANDIDQETTLVPPLMLQPFVENSIWHGIAKKQGKGQILVEIYKENEMLDCIIEDNGIGRDSVHAKENQQVNTPKTSMGMKITKARIDILNKVKKTKASIELHDLVEGLRVEVKLPLELSF